MKLERKNTGWINPADAETIEQAWWTVQRNSVVAPCRDVIDFADYDTHEDYIQSEVQTQLKNVNKASVEVEFWTAPRSNGICRLVSLPDVVTRVTLQSLGLSLSHPLNAQLLDSVLSRPGPLRSTTFVDGWYSQWSQYFARILRIKNKFRYLVVSDFANFFDSVNASHLSRTLQKAGVPKSHTRAACQLLKKCSYAKPGQESLGLPQLYDDTALLLANFYLRDFDLEVGSRWGSERYTRWLDDIVLGAQTESEAWKLIAHLSTAARDSGLNLNPHKTKAMLSADLDRNYLFLNEHKRLDSLELEMALRLNYKADIRAEKSFETILIDVRNRLGSGLGEILLRRLYRLGSVLGSSRLVPFVVMDLTTYPNSASAICQYITSLAQDEQIASIVARYLEQPSNVYQTVEVGLLLSLLHRRWTKEAKNRIGKLAMAILQGRLPVISDISFGIAALLLRECVGASKAAKTLMHLKASLLASSSLQAQRFAFTALCCSLPVKEARKLLQAKTLMQNTHLQFLYTFLATRSFTLDGLIQTDARVTN
jgi:hypothetical protein